MNESRVLPARLALHKKTGGEAEVLVLEQVPGGGGCWRALVRPGRRIRSGTVLYAAGPDGSESAVVEVGAPADPDAEDGVRLVRLLGSGSQAVTTDDTNSGIDVLERFGELPLPPYITAPLADAERYQTVYARNPGSVAAPTAGLHLTEELLERCRARGVATACIELQVGLGTFRPIAASTVEDHHMHAERYLVPSATWEACQRARRVVAVGTTSVRALESAAATGALSGRTDLFIHRPHRFRLVDLLLTNFHLPRSSLLVMIDAFVGSRWRELYERALEERYRFLSFGDAMLMKRQDS